MTIALRGCQRQLVYGGRTDVSPRSKLFYIRLDDLLRVEQREQADYRLHSSDFPNPPMKNVYLPLIILLQETLSQVA
jgi:hypothetical protein